MKRLMRFRMINVTGGGFVRLVDSMGSDARIVQAARVSYGDGTKTVRNDEHLIDYLIRHHHTSPLEQVVFTFHLKTPMFVARQWMRHRMGRVNEVSARYSELPSDYHKVQQFRVQSNLNKQATIEPLNAAHAAEARAVRNVATQSADRAYKHLLGLGVAREQAREVLPASVFTEFYWQMDLNNLFKFLNLRLAWNAQAETRAYAEAVLELARPVAPVAFVAFDEHVRGAVTLSKSERDVLRKFVQSRDAGALERFAKADGLRASRVRELMQKVINHD